MRKITLLLFWLMLLSSACTTQNVSTASQTPQPTHTSAPTLTPSPTETPPPTLTATPITFTLDQLAGMSESEKLASAPDQAGYTEAESTVKDNIVKYYDGDGKLDHAYDLLAGQEVSLAEAGIIEFSTGSSALEMLRFDDAESLLNFVVENTVWLNEAEVSRMDAGNAWLRGPNPQRQTLFKEVRGIEGFESKLGTSLPMGDLATKVDDYFQLFLGELNTESDEHSGTVAVFEDEAGLYIPLFGSVSYEDFANYIKYLDIPRP